MAIHTRVYQWVEHYPRRSAVVALLLFGFFARLIAIAHPVSAVFDEVHFNYFASFYYSGQYFYDIHPPLGKLLIALSALPFGGIAPEDVIRTISTPYPNSNYIAMRMLPVLFGTMLPAMLFLIAKELKLSTRAAFIAGALCALDNALLIQSKLILLDAMLLGFGFGALWLFLVARRKQNSSLLFVSAICAGCSISIKWIGVSFLGLIGLIMIADWLAIMWRKRGWQNTPFLQGIAYLCATAAVYVCIFYLHFALLPNSHEQGDQFMSYSFRSTLAGSEYANTEKFVIGYQCPSDYRHKLRYGLPDDQVKPAEALVCNIRYEAIKPPSFIIKLAELNRVMYTTNQGLSQKHPDASPWYSWPIMYKPLYYWHHEGARIYLLGNPMAWWFCALGVIILLLGQFKYPVWRQNEAFWILVTGYWASLLPFMMVSRVMFMYHYLTSMCFSILLTALILDKLKISLRLSTIIVLLALFCFLLISPLTYGFNWFGSDMLWFLRLFGWHP